MRGPRQSPLSELSLFTTWQKSETQLPGSDEFYMPSVDRENGVGGALSCCPLKKCFYAEARVGDLFKHSSPRLILAHGVSTGWSI